MVIEAVKNIDIKAYKSECYVGMTAEDAKEAGRSIFREFKRINTDGNNELSIEEITAQRDRAATKKRRWGNLFLGIGACWSYNGLRLEMMPKEKKELLEELYKIVSTEYKTKVTTKLPRTLSLLGAIFFAGMAFVKHNGSKNIDDETFEHNVNYCKQIAS